MTDESELIERLREASIRGKAAVQLVRLQQRVADLERERDDISKAIGSVRFMDPPDGGSVTLAEQITRMREALAFCEAKVLALTTEDK